MLGRSGSVRHSTVQHRPDHYRCGLRSAFYSHIQRVLATGWVVLVAGVFFTAAFSKLFDPSGMQRSLQWYGSQVGLASGLTLSFSKAVFLAVVLSEILLGAVLLSGRFTRLSLIGASVLLSVFVAWLLHARLLGMEAPCECGVPPLFGEGTGGAIARNVLLASGSLLAAWSCRNTSSTLPQDGIHAVHKRNPRGADSAQNERGIEL